MIEKLTQEHLRRWMKDLCNGIIEEDGQGRFVFTINCEEEHLPLINGYAFVDDTCLIVDGYTEVYDIPKEKIFECLFALNEYNKLQYPIKVVLVEGRIYFRHTLHVSEPVSEKHVLEDGLGLGLLSISVAVERMDKLLREVGILN